MNIAKNLLCVFCFLFSSLFICSCQISKPQAISKPQEVAKPIDVAKSLDVSVEVIPAEVRVIQTIVDVVKHPFLILHHKDFNNQISLLDVTAAFKVYYSDTDVKVFKVFFAQLSYNSKRQIVLPPVSTSIEKCEVYGTAVDVHNKPYKFEAVWRKQ